MASSSVGGSTFSMDDYETLMATTDVELLKRAWRNEKAAPEILRFEVDLIQRIRGQMQLMKCVQKMSGLSWTDINIFRKVKEETAEEYASSGIDPLTVSLYQMDFDRAQFLLRSYLRIRIQKIDKYIFRIEKTDELWNRLSKDEKGFARRCADDLKQHLDENVLSKLPDNYQSVQKQSVISEEDDMVPEPQLDAFVVCRSKEYLSGIQLEDGPVDDRSKLFEMEPGVLYFICYKSIKALVESGKVELVC